jgi:DNA-binding winged helix-turn-helix (wHTH) protein
MGCVVSESIETLLLRLSEAGEPATLWGRQAKPHFGSEFERLLARRIIVEQEPATEWPVCASCECGLDARPVQAAGDHHIAPCPYDHRCDATLDDDDLRSFRIDGAVLIKEIAAASGIGNEPEPTLPGVWHFGPLDSKRMIFGALSILAATQPGLIVAMQAAARGQPMTLVAPPLPMSERQQFKQAGIHLVAVGDAIGHNGAAWALDPTRLAPEIVVAPRLVIGRSAKSVCLDGTDYALSDQTFNLLCLLAARAQGDQPFVTTRDIEQETWGSSLHRVSRSARDVVRELREALVAGASDPDAVRQLIENKRNRGWRLTLPADAIDLRD